MVVICRLDPRWGKEPSDDITSPFSAVTLRFKTDFSGVGHGFYIVYSSISSEKRVRDDSVSGGVLATIIVGCLVSFTVSVVCCVCARHMHNERCGRDTSTDVNIGDYTTADQCDTSPADGCGSGHCGGGCD